MKTIKIKQDKKRLAVQTDVRAGFDWNDLWADIQEVGSDIGTGVSEAVDSAQAAIHNATAPDS